MIKYGKNGHRIAHVLYAHVRKTAEGTPAQSAAAEKEQNMRPSSLVGQTERCQRSP